MKKKSRRVALIQMASEKFPQGCQAKALKLAQKAAQQGAQIICLQELYRSRYFCEGYRHKNFELAENVNGPSREAFSKLAKKTKSVMIVPIFEKRAEGVYHNSALVLDADGSMRGLYRKMHIPDDPHFYEKFYFTPGDLGFQAFDTAYGKIGVLICWDQWFPEAARLTALAGAQILFYPTAIGWHHSETQTARKAQLAGWKIVQQGHAVANEVFVAVANRVGREKGLTFWGHSFVAGPFGDILAEARESHEEILLADCDFSKIEEVRRHWPFLRDRRIDAYGSLTERFLNDDPRSKKPKTRKGKKPVSCL
ncbi:MAG: carbon-nitrogen hydrolase [Candidatus Omnitrophica bacterium]|nr:carbon-nitrogen hydrolase [Candidatus Omnitrophota bacterium]